MRVVVYKADLETRAIERLQGCRHQLIFRSSINRDVYVPILREMLFQQILAQLLARCGVIQKMTNAILRNANRQYIRVRVGRFALRHRELGKRKKTRCDESNAHGGYGTRIRELHIVTVSRMLASEKLIWRV